MAVRLAFSPFTLILGPVFPSLFAETMLDDVLTSLLDLASVKRAVRERELVNVNEGAF